MHISCLKIVTNSQHTSHFLITLKLFFWSKHSQARNKMFTTATSTSFKFQRAAIEILHLNRCINCFKAHLGSSRKITYRINLDGIVSLPLDPLNVIKCIQLKSTYNTYFYTAAGGGRGAPPPRRSQ
jgi:hypothetical protein